MRRVLILVVAVLALYYFAEELSVRFHIPRSRNPIGQMTVYRYDAIRQKNGKLDLDAEPPLTVTCVHALFPHLSYAPCWYVARHTDQRIDY
jgi:hypothetical protein